ncbi:hypothetical protein ATCC90586_004920 [Pythium insidiosum]|nr:hypothetical protein ATCC90586_004920 [Pythium insidiosum]
MPPAMTEQLAAINPALAAWVAALAQPNNGSQASRLQPEEEPADAGDARDANVQAMDAANAALLADKMNMSKKIETRTITVPPFDGSVPQGSFDAKAREFCEELNEQMEVAQVLAGQTWSDDVKKAVFKTHLTGMARRWYSGWCTENPAATYANSADALIWEFRPMLLGVDVAERIKKRPAEANAATVERKKKPKPSQNPTRKGQITCYECGATGHTADFCRTYLQGNKDGKFGNGAAQLAESNSVVDNVDMEDDE